jgi:hypothetical protein
LNASGEVRFPFEDFTMSPVPASIDACRAYRQLATGFIEARNSRILQACSPPWKAG